MLLAPIGSVQTLFMGVSKRNVALLSIRGWNLTFFQLLQKYRSFRCSSKASIQDDPLLMALRTFLLSLAGPWDRCHFAGTAFTSLPSSCTAVQLGRFIFLRISEVGIWSRYPRHSGNTRLHQSALFVLDVNDSKAWIDDPPGYPFCYSKET